MKISGSLSLLCVERQEMVSNQAAPLTASPGLIFHWFYYHQRKLVQHLLFLGFEVRKEHYLDIHVAETTWLGDEEVHRYSYGHGTYHSIAQKQNEERSRKFLCGVGSSLSQGGKLQWELVHDPSVGLGWSACRSLRQCSVQVALGQQSCYARERASSWLLTCRASAVDTP